MSPSKPSGCPQHPLFLNTARLNLLAILQPVAAELAKPQTAFGFVEPSLAAPKQFSGSFQTLCQEVDDL